MSSFIRYGLCATLIAAGSLTTPAASHAQTPAAVIDSLTRLLDSPSLQVRARAIGRLRGYTPSQIPTATRSKLYGLLETAGRTVEPLTTVDREDAASGETQMQLAKLVLSFRDPAATQALALGGIEISTAVQDFVASQGSSAVPALDESLRIDPTRRTSVLSTFALMLRNYASSITPDLQGRLRSNILASASDDTITFVFASKRGGLIEAIPFVEALQTAGKEPEIVPSALEALLAIRGAASTSSLVTSLQAAHDGVCYNAQNAKNGACQSTDSHLKNVRSNFDGGRLPQAAQALREFIDRVNIAQSNGAFTAVDAMLLVGSANYLMTRLQ